MKGAGHAWSPDPRGPDDPCERVDDPATETCARERGTRARCSCASSSFPEATSPSGSSMRSASTRCAVQRAARWRHLTTTSATATIVRWIRAQGELRRHHREQGLVDSVRMDRRCDVAVFPTDRDHRLVVEAQAVQPCQRTQRCHVDLQPVLASPRNLHRFAGTLYLLICRANELLISRALLDDFGAAPKRNSQDVQHRWLLLRCGVIVCAANSHNRTIGGGIWPASSAFIAPSIEITPNGSFSKSAGRLINDWLRRDRLRSEQQVQLRVSAVHSRREGFWQATRPPQRGRGHATVAAGVQAALPCVHPPSPAAQQR